MPAVVGQGSEGLVPFRGKTLLRKTLRRIIIYLLSMVRPRDSSVSYSSEVKKTTILAKKN
jgi:hypothetical protein